MIEWIVIGISGMNAFVAGLNLLVMPRPKLRSTPPSEPLDLSKIVVLIPARNEEKNLQTLLPALLVPHPDLRVIVFDDESDDRTAEIAKLAGASVIHPREPLPKGWTGKNRACHELAKVAIEATNAEWLLYLDADTEPLPGFLGAMLDLAAGAKQAGVVTGIPRIIPGRGIEPLFLAWVGWSILANNPFGLVQLSGMSHSRFTNGQVHMWRRSVYSRLWPNELLKSRVMEDVMIGRMLAKEKVPVVTANLSGVLLVRMYETWRQTLDGMSKNSHEIAGTWWGSTLVAALLLFIAWGWLLCGPLMAVALGLQVLSSALVALIARAPLWPALVSPIALTIGAFTVLRSMVWHQRGTVKWAGREYPGV